jgi:hypothetical protein
MAASYKIRGGKPVLRTEQEQANLDQLKVERYGSAGEVEKPKTPKRKYVMTTESQLKKLMQTGSFSCVMIFHVLWYQGFRHHWKSFLMPTKSLLEEGFSGATQRRVLVQLEQVGLILISRRPPQLPNITILRD